LKNSIGIAVKAVASKSRLLSFASADKRARQFLMTDKLILKIYNGKMPAVNRSRRDTRLANKFRI
jgi:hypothetical protein